MAWPRSWRAGLGRRASCHSFSVERISRYFLLTRREANAPILHNLRALRPWELAERPLLTQARDPAEPRGQLPPLPPLPRTPTLPDRAETDERVLGTRRVRTDYTVFGTPSTPPRNRKNHT